MKTLKYILLGVILSSLVFSSFSIFPSKKSFTQSGTVIFCETYSQQELISKLDPDESFFSWVQMENTDPSSSKIGTCREIDLDQLWSYFKSENFRAKVPKDLIIAAGAETKNQMIALYAIKKNASNNVFPTGSDLKEVSVIKDDQEDNYSLYISFSESGAEKWASMTRLNVGKDIAILFDSKVISAPRLREEIKNGLCSISGKFTKSEINELKAVLEN